MRRMHLSLGGLALLAMAVAGCGGDAASPTSTGDGAEPRAASPAAPSPSAGASSTETSDVIDVGCARDDPEDVGDLTGAWSSGSSSVGRAAAFGAYARVPARSSALAFRDL